MPSADDDQAAQPAAATPQAIGHRRVRRQDLELLSHGPLARMGVVSETGEFLWSNTPMNDLLRISADRAFMTLADLLGTPMAAERLARHPRVYEHAQSDMFYELLGGVRHLTRLLPLDAEDFTARGVLVVALPAVHPRSPGDAPTVTLSTGSWGHLSRLSNRELEVLRLMALRACTKAVASTLGRSVKTVENQIQSIHDKLAISMRGELVRIAVESGLHAFEDDEWRPLIACRAVA